MKRLYEAPREWQKSKDPEKILSLFQNKIRVRELYRKNTIPPAVFSLNHVDEKGIQFYYPPAEDLQGVITLYTTANKHIECDFSLAEQLDTGSAYLHPLEIRVGVSIRSQDRIPVQSSDILVSNIQISKGEIRSGAEVRVTNRIIFNEFEKRLGRELPGLAIHDPSDVKAPAYVRSIKKHTDPLIIQDTSLLHGRPEPDTDEAYYLETLINAGNRDEELKRIRDRRIRSLVCVPLMVPGQNEPLACFTMETTAPLQRENAPVARLQEEGKKLLDRIMEANTVKISEKQEIQDLSEKGMSLVVTSESLMPLLHGGSIMTFDLVFRRQSPVRLQGIVRHMHQAEGRIHTGIEFDGSALSHMSDKPMERLKNLVQLYKEKKI